MPFGFKKENSTLSAQFWSQSAYLFLTKKTPYTTKLLELKDVKQCLISAIVTKHHLESTNRACNVVAHIDKRLRVFNNKAGNQTPGIVQVNSQNYCLVNS